MTIHFILLIMIPSKFIAFLLSLPSAAFDSANSSLVDEEQGATGITDLGADLAAPRLSSRLAYYIHRIAYPVNDAARRVKRLAVRQAATDR